MLDEGPEQGTFSYELEHFPQAGTAIRRVEVHQLPLGAELLSFSTNATQRIRNNRNEVVLDQIVPASGSIGLSYRYRLVPAPASTPSP
jgi:hypothetical protein